MAEENVPQGEPELVQDESGQAYVAWPDGSYLPVSQEELAAAANELQYQQAQETAYAQARENAFYQQYRDERFEEMYAEREAEKAEQAYDQFLDEALVDRPDVDRSELDQFVADPAYETLEEALTAYDAWVYANSEPLPEPAPTRMDGRAHDPSFDRPVGSGFDEAVDSIFDDMRHGRM